MDFFFASGDHLLIDPEAKADPESVNPGDIIAYLDWADAPMVSVHRVFLRFRAKDGSRRFLTKGDGNLWFDPPVGGGQVIGKVVGLERAGLAPLFLKSGPGFRAGLLIAAYSYFAVLAVRSCAAAAALLQRALCLAAACAACTARYPAVYRRILPPLLKAGLWADLNRHESFYSFFAWLPGKITGAAPVAGTEPRPGRAETFISGAIGGRLVLSGNVTVGGDVTVLPGASLVLRPGTRLSFGPGKYANTRALRHTERGTLDFKNGKLSKLVVYGELVCAGEPSAPVELGTGGKWDCLLFLGRSRGTLAHTVVSGAVNPLRAMDFSSVRLKNSGPCPGRLKEFLVVSGCSRAVLAGVSLSGVRSPAAAHDLSRLAVTGCAFTDTETAIYAGGAARCRVRCCKFSNFRTHALGAGGGAAVFVFSCSSSGGKLPFFGAGASSLSLRGVEVSAASGAAVTFRGRRLKLSSCRVRDNAGGLFFSGSGARFKSSVFSGNKGFSLEAVSGRLVAEDCLFEDGSGPAAVSFGGEELEFSGCRVRGNARGLLFSGRRAVLKRSVFSENSVSALDAGTGDLAAEGCVFESNPAAPFATLSCGRLEMRSCRVRGNAGGLLVSGRDAFVVDSIFSGNSGCALELTGGNLGVDGCSFLSNPEGFRAGAGTKTSIERCSMDGAEDCAVIAAGAGAMVALAGIRMTRCRRGIHGSGAVVTAADAHIHGCSERGAFLEAGASLVFLGGEISGSGAQAVRLEGGARLNMEGSVLKMNSDGISSENGAVTLQGAHFSGNSGTSISLSRGGHSVKQCVVADGAVGIGLYNGAVLEGGGLALSAVTGPGLEISGSRAVLSSLVFRDCGEGVKLGERGSFEASGFIVERALSHGLSAGGGASARVKDVNISFCGGCAVIGAGACELSLEAAVIANCRSGLTLREGCGAAVTASSITDIEGAGISSAGGRLTAEKVLLARAAAGFSLHSGSNAAIAGAEMDGLPAGLEATGGSKIGMSGSTARGCARGAWLQDGSVTELSRCVFENSSVAAIYADASVCSSRDTVFRNNNIGVFSDRGSRVGLSGARFLGNRTGIKADNSAKVSLVSSAVRGCEWDGVWCGGGADLKLESNIFSDNRYAIKEDGPCLVKAAGNKFRSSSEGDHLAWPRPPAG